MARVFLFGRHFGVCGDPTGAATATPSFLPPTPVLSSAAGCVVMVVVRRATVPADLVQIENVRNPSTKFNESVRFKFQI